MATSATATRRKMRRVVLITTVPAATPTIAYGRCRPTTTGTRKSGLSRSSTEVVLLFCSPKSTEIFSSWQLVFIQGIVISSCRFNVGIEVSYEEYEQKRDKIVAGLEKKFDTVDMTSEDFDEDEGAELDPVEEEEEW